MSVTATFRRYIKHGGRTWRFRNKAGLVHSWVTIKWSQSGVWTGEAYVFAPRYGDPIYSGVIQATKKKDLPKLMRLALEERKNPKLKEITAKLTGTSQEDALRKILQEDYDTTMGRRK